MGHGLFTTFTKAPSTAPALGSSAALPRVQRCPKGPMPWAGLLASPLQAAPRRSCPRLPSATAPASAEARAPAPGSAGSPALTGARHRGHLPLAARRAPVTRARKAPRLWSSAAPSGCHSWSKKPELRGLSAKSRGGKKRHTPCACAALHARGLPFPPPRSLHFSQKLQAAPRKPKNFRSPSLAQPPCPPSS